MNMPFNKLVIAAATAGALSLSMTPLAFADVAHTQTAPMVLAASETVDNAEEAVTDTWITSKVKSTFVADSALSALDIKVETNKGVVSLSGVVKSDAERDLAVAKTKGIKGVKAVSADGLKSAE